MPTENPLPCPFCGASPRVERTALDPGYLVLCRNRDCWAGASTHVHVSRAEAIAAWNTRAPVRPQPKKGAKR